MATIAYDPAFFGDTPTGKGGDATGTTRPYDPAFFGDDPAPIPEAKKPEDKPSALTSVVRRVGGQVVPVLAGAATGAFASAKTPGPPIAKLGASIVGALGGGFAAAMGQEEVFQAAPGLASAVGQSPEQRAADYETNPGWSKAADIGSEFLVARPSLSSAKGIISLLKSDAPAALKDVGKSALKVGAFNAALEGGVSAGVQAAASDQPIDWVSVLGDAGVGALGQKTTRLGRAVGMTDGVDVRPNTPQPVPTEKPATLLLPRGTDFYASETGLVSPNRDIRSAANEAAPAGTQGDLFSLGGEDTTQVARDPVRPPQEQALPPDQGGQAPVPMDGAGQPSLFTASPTATVAPQFGPVEVRRAVVGGAKPDAYGLKLAQKVHGFLKDSDPVAAAAHLDAEADNLAFADIKPKTIDLRLEQLARARTLVADYTSKMTNALAEEGVQKPKDPSANNLSPAPVEPSVAAIRETNTQRTEAEAPKPGPTDDAVAHANQVAEDGRRQSILQHVLSDPTTISPAKRFAALLKRQNLDPAPRAYEKDEIISSLVRKGRAEEAKTAFEGLTESGNPPDTEGGAAPLEKFIPERQPKPVAAPAAPAPIKAPAKDTFKLEPQTEGDLKAIEAARVRREGKAERRDVAAEAAKPAAAQGELFTPKGNPTKVAADAAKRPPLPKDTAPVVVKKSAKPTTKRPQLPKDKTNGQEDAAPVRKEGRDDARQEVQAGREKEVGEYTAVKKRADAAVAARSITPKQHGMVEAAIAAKSHTPEELGKELDKILTRSSEKAFTPDGENKYRAGTPDAAKAPTVDDVKGIVAHVTSRWKGDNKVEVVKSVDDLPEDVAAQVREDKAEGAAGFVAKDGTIYLLADNNVSPADVKATLFHEGLGHVGLAKQFRARLDEVLMQIHSTNQTVREATTQWLKDNPNAYEGEGRLARAVEEVLARKSEGGEITASMWAKIVATVKDFARRLGFDVNVSDRDVDAILSMAHNQIVKGGKDALPPGQHRYMMSGPEHVANGDSREMTFRARDLEIAKDMEEAGREMDDIRLTTGWHKNEYDGMWRHEFSDKDTGFTEAWAKMKSRDANGRPNQMKLGDAFDHPELYKRYPDARDITIQKTASSNDSMMGVTQGWYDDATNTLNISPRSSDGRGTLLHEVQHWIQNREGFALGGNTKGVTQMATAEQNARALRSLKDETGRNKEKYAAQLDALEKLGARWWFQTHPLIKEYNKAEKALDRARNTNDWKILSAAMDVQRGVLTNIEQYLFENDGAPLTDKQQDVMSGVRSALMFGLDRTYNNNAYLYNAVQKRGADLAMNDPATTRRILEAQKGYEMYQNIAGEIEARDTTKRMDFDDVTRNEIKPGSSYKVPKEDVIVNRGRVAGQLSTSQVMQNIAAAPKEQRDNLTRLARIASVKLTKGLSAIAMGNHVYDMAANRGITSARTLERVNTERQAAANALLQPHLRLIERARNLPQETLREVNRLIQDSTSSEAYAFYPAYLREGVPDASAPGGMRYEVSRKAGMNVKVDPELNKRYKALPPEARKAVTEAFRLSHDRMYDEKNAVLSHVTTSYDGLIADTKDLLSKTTDIKKRGALIADIRQFNVEKKQALSAYGSLLSIDPNRPYAPLTRNGNWLVTAKSDKYLDAEARGDTAALSKMQQDPDHYFVDFAGSHREGFKLADEIEGKYGKLDQNVFVQERNKFSDRLYGGRDMTLAVQRLENLARQSDAPPSTRALINDLKLKTLSQNSVRRSEIQRRNVASGDLDMLRNIMSHGKSAAHFIGNLYHAEEVLDALQKVKKEVDYPGGKQTREGRDDRQAIVNEITARHEANMNRPVDDDDLMALTASKINSMTSLYMLAAKPSYYAQQLMQSWMYSLPTMAGRFGYGQSTKALGAAYKTVVGVMKAQEGLTNLDQLDLSKMPAKYRALADHMYQNGILDVGINTEMGGTNATRGLSAVGEKVMDKVRGLSRKVEAINRLTAGIAQYDLDMANPGKSQTQHDAGAYAAYLRDFDRLKDVQGYDFAPLTKDQFTAADNAVRTTRQSHGDLGAANSPALFNKPMGKIILQYKKFPLIMAGMMGREIEKSFLNKSIPAVERAVARKTLGFLMGHTALMAGASGTIGYNVAKMLYDYVMSSAADEPRDMEADIRKAIGDPMVADLILKGAPTLANADLSGTLGMGNLLSVAPFAEVPKDRDTLAQFALSAMGPFIGGLLPRAFDGMNYMAQGDYYKMVENITPRGVSDVIRSTRERTEGVTNKRGELLVGPENIPAMSTVWRALGFQSLDQAKRSTATDIKFKQDDYYKAEVIGVKRDYIKAVEADDAAAKAEARAAWKKLQDDRVEHGLKRQPFSDLLKAPRDKAKRERNTEGGMQFTNRDEGAVQELTDLFSQDVEDDADPALRDALAE